MTQVREAAGLHREAVWDERGYHPGYGKGVCESDGRPWPCGAGNLRVVADPTPEPTPALDVERLAIEAAARLEGEVSRLRTELAACTEAYAALPAPGNEALRTAATKARDLIAHYLWSEDDSGDEDDLHTAYEGLGAIIGPTTEEGLGQTLARLAPGLDVERLAQAMYRAYDQEPNNDWREDAAKVAAEYGATLDAAPEDEALDARVAVLKTVRGLCERPGFDDATRLIAIRAYLDAAAPTAPQADPDYGHGDRHD